MPTPQTTIHDLDQYSMVFGPVLFDGFAEGEALSIEFSPGFTFLEGADGKVVRSKTMSKTALCTFKLLGTSAANSKMSTIYLGDIAAPNGAGVLPLLVRNRQGLTVFQSASAWIEKMPDVSIAAEDTPREWAVRCSMMDPFVAGA